MLLSVRGVRWHGLFGPLSMGLVDGRRASRKLLKQFVGRLISARRELTLTLQGDLASRLDLRSLGVAGWLVIGDQGTSCNSHGCNKLGCGIDINECVKGSDEE